MTENVVFLKTFRSFAEAEDYIQKLKNPETLGIIQLYYDEDLSLFAITSKSILEQLV